MSTPSARWQIHETWRIHNQAAQFERGFEDILGIIERAPPHLEETLGRLVQEQKRWFQLKVAQTVAQSITQSRFQWKQYLEISGFLCNRVSVLIPCLNLASRPEKNKQYLQQLPLSYVDQRRERI
jgi:hypothetical protein